MNKKISIIFIMILCSLLCITPTLTYASSYTTKITLKGVDRAPRLSMATSGNKNLVLKLVEGGSISSVKLEKIENDKSTVLLNKDSKNNKKAKGITISSDLKEIKIAKSLLKTDSYTKFKITAYDKNSIDNNKLIAYFNVKMLKTKDAEKGWYSINNSPRLSYSAGFTITVTDYSKVKSLSIKDMNNNNAKVSIGNPLSGSTEYVKKYKIDLSKLKAKNDMYFLQLTVVDNGGMKRVEEIIVKTEKTKVKVENNSNKNTTATTTTTNSNTSQTPTTPTTSTTPTTPTASTNDQTTNNTSNNTEECKHSIYKLSEYKQVDCQLVKYKICKTCNKNLGIDSSSKKTNHVGGIESYTVQDKNNPCRILNYERCKTCKKNTKYIGSKMQHCNTISSRTDTKTETITKGCYVTTKIKCKYCAKVLKTSQEKKHNDNGATYKTVVIQNPTKANNCIKITQKRCTRCNTLCGNKVSTEQHNYVTINTVDLRNFGYGVTYRKKCKVCGKTTTVMQ